MVQKLTEGLDEPQNYFMKVSFGNDRGYEQKMNIKILTNDIFIRVILSFLIDIYSI